MDNKQFMYNGVDLRTATIFDITDDQQYLSRFYSPELGIKNKADYLALGTDTPQNRAIAMLEFAEEQNDDLLAKQIRAIYKNELLALFNE